MVGGKPRGILHTTEGTRMSSGAPYYHIGFKDSAAGITIVQWRPFGKASRALRNLRGGVQTNRQGDFCVNAVVIGYARNAANWSNELLVALRTFMLWCDNSLGVPMNVSPKAGGGSECYGYTSPCRMTKTEWVGFGGWAGHQNVPENTHWDPGKVNWNYLMTGDGAPPPPPPPQSDWTKELIMALPTLKKYDGYKSYNKAHLQPDVKNLQGLNLANGFKDNKSVDPEFACDGYFGPGTEASVEGFQRSAGLTPDGVVGRNTWTKLLGE